MNKTEFKASRLRLQEVATRLREINSWCEETKKKISDGKRKMNDDEKDKFDSYSSEKEALVREKDILGLSVEAFKAGVVPSEREISGKRAFAQIVNAIYRKKEIPEEFRGLVDGNEITIPLTRDDVVTALADVSPSVPTTIGDIILPLNNKIIYDKIGMKMQFGLKGNFVYPVLASCTCDFEGENVELTDKKISMSSLSPVPKRVGITIPVSNTAIDESNTSLQDVVLGQIQQAIANMINKWMFGKTLIANNANGGCLYAALNTPAVTTAVIGAVTWGEVLDLEIAVMETGVIIDKTAAFVCNSKMLGILKRTPKETNTAQFIAEGNAANCTVDGFPVFVTEDVPDNYLGFGVFQYNLLGQFGQVRLIVDPYTMATKNQTRFTLNTSYANLVMRNEAFAALAIKTA